MKKLYAIIACCLLISYTTFSQSTTDCSVNSSGVIACEESLVTLSCNPNVSLGKNVTSYSWTGPNNFTSSLQKPTLPKITLNQNGIYTIKITTDDGCTASSTTQVTINPIPQLTTSNDSPRCAGSEIKLFVRDSYPFFTTNYLWSGPNNFSSTQQNPVLTTTINLIQSGTYRVEGKNRYGCISVATTTVKIENCQALYVDNTSQCNNGIIKLTATGGNIYMWTGPNNFTSTEQKPILKNVNYRNRGIYSVNIDNKTILTMDVIVKDPVAFTVPKEISVCENTDLIFFPNTGRLTDSTEIPIAYTLQNPQTRLNITNLAGSFTANKGFITESGNYTFTGTGDYNTCEVSKNIKINVDKNTNCKSIEIEPMQDIKMCYGQEVSIPFKTNGNFKQGTKFKVYILNSGESLNLQRLPNAIVEKSPIVFKSIPEKYNDNKIQIFIVTDDIEKV